MEPVDNPYGQAGAPPQPEGSAAAGPARPGREPALLGRDVRPGDVWAPPHPRGDRPAFAIRP
ncbi:hypothetical protein ACQP1K_28215 [Sphaerimonospora sp. CA-214678]|uniref:hypothetical protein n=1 Tax=Sphaerimonospora sp. CA-214678 TaxID=3240029 RepID=UPI003D8C1537